MDIIVIKGIFFKYIFLPLIVIILAAILIYCKKKVAVIKNKTLIIYVLVASLCLGLPGFLGVYGNVFNPYLYLFAMVIYLFLGILNVNLLYKYFNTSNVKLSFSIFFKTLITVTSLLFGAYIFYQIFNWMSPYEGYALMASTSMLIFIVPLSFYYAYLQFINIPFDIYKTWRPIPYQQPVDVDGIDYNKLMVLNFELAKKIEEGKRSRIKAKAPSKGVEFGDWFYKVVSDYNHKNPDSVIYLSNMEQEPYSWVFYIKKSIFHFRKYIDFNRDIVSNNISENSIIICKRVAKNTLDDSTTLI